MKQFWIVRIVYPERFALIGSSGHLIPSGLALFCPEEPIHIPSVLVRLTARPDNFWKSSGSLKARGLIWYPKGLLSCHRRIALPLLPSYQYELQLPIRTAIPSCSTSDAITKRGKWVSLSDSSLKGKIIWCNTIVYDTTLYVFIDTHRIKSGRKLKYCRHFKR